MHLIPAFGAESGEYINWTTVWYQPKLHSKFQESQGYIVGVNIVGIEAWG